MASRSWPERQPERTPLRLSLSRDPARPRTCHWPRFAAGRDKSACCSQSISQAAHPGRCVCREALDDDAAWKAVETQGYLRIGPLHKKSEECGIPFIPDEPLPELKEKKQRHPNKDVEELSALAFFEKDDTGLDAV